MPVFVDSTNTLKRPGRFTAGGPQKKKQCSDNRDSRCQSAFFEEELNLQKFTLKS
jgi:hypothetical protein